MDRRTFIKSLVAGGTGLLVSPALFSQAYSGNELTVDDFQFYRAQESNVRSLMKRFETEKVLPLARAAVKEIGRAHV